MAYNKKIGFVYKWTNKINGKWYIGSHHGNTDDGYTASGKLIKRAFEKYSISSFKREILYEGTDYKKKEEYYLNINDAANHSKSYNLINHSYGGSVKGLKSPKKGLSYEEMYGTAQTNKIKKKQVIAHTGKTTKLKGRKQTEEHKRKSGVAQRGRSQTEEHIRKRMEKMIGNKNGRGNKGVSKMKSKCPCCGLVGGANNMKRWHFDNCKKGRFNATA